MRIPAHGEGPRTEPAPRNQAQTKTGQGETRPLLALRPELRDYPAAARIIRPLRSKVGLVTAPEKGGRGMADVKLEVAALKENMALPRTRPKNNTYSSRGHCGGNPTPRMKPVMRRTASREHTADGTTTSVDDDMAGCRQRAPTTMQPLANDGQDYERVRFV